MKLRKMTSAGMMDCKQALTEENGDFDKAVEIIREKGKLVAAKRADRQTSEGAVLARIADGKAVLVSLGCETDFVSATPDFKTLAANIADAAISAFPADAAALQSVKLADGHTVEEEISAGQDRRKAPYRVLSDARGSVHLGVRAFQRQDRSHCGFQQGGPGRTRTWRGHAGGFHESRIGFRSRLPRGGA